MIDMFNVGTRRFIKQVSVFLIAVLCLQGCMNVASTGAQAIYNRHSWQKNINDQIINMNVSHEIFFATKDFKDTNITISTYNGDVLLAGQVPQTWQKTKAGELAQGVEGVKQVYNTITVASPSSALTKVSDTWITTKIKAKLMACNDLDATQIKVVTENGTVYLIGTVPPDEASAAVDIARNTDGVLRVVRIFSYVHVSKQLS